jgi:hypothetical protein
MILKEFITEEATKNKHLEHVEEEILNRGREGADYAIGVMMNFADMLKGRSNKKLKVSVKWDGAPAVVCGIDPETKKFFVATKGAFAKTPKLAFTKEDIQKIFPDYLWDKLGPCLEHLPKLGIKGVLQGDLMFNQEMKSKADIDGEEYITFKPNNITYAFQSNSAIGKIIDNAKLGMVFHTQYVGGETLADMSAQFGVDISYFKKSNDVWVDDATFKDVTGSVLLTKDEQAQVKQDLADAMAAYKAVPAPLFQAMAQNQEFIVWFKRTINDYIRNNKLPGDPDQFLNDFIESYKLKMQNEINKLASQDPEKPAVKSRMAKIETQINLINQYRKGLASVLTFIKEISNLKLLFVRKLNNVETVAHFFREPDGSYTATSPEGYVAIDHTGGAVKFVDRLEFSRRNFMAKDFG